ncbi:cytochrome b5 [Plasmodium gonderi]|uniref:Cytochrome b5 n=1 Tax=Plasmodium gonderi TaxID=77519 RepID=A0A1Y1JMJ8_PLAGO|nr:cytochrome b5 [Plasmodium gonderi]GAW83699.1 cytochrome b5 [Plasmodium gonderi]
MRAKKLKVIDDKELQKLKKESKCCIFINDLVYDVSSFYEHPGGVEVLQEYNGKDATEAFKQIGHSKSAQKLMKTYLIGIKKNSTLYKKKISTKTVEDKTEYLEYSEAEVEDATQANGEITKQVKTPEEEKINYPLVASVIFLFSIIYYFMFLKK